MLVEIPLVDQLNEPTLDAGPDENAHANCVPACVAAILKWRWPQQADQYDGDAILDAVYGEGHIGGTDEGAFVPYLQSLGLAVTQLVLPTATQADILDTSIRWLQMHRPVLVAIPAPWIGPYAVTPSDPRTYSGVTHAVVLCDYYPLVDMVVAMNPWPQNGATAEYNVFSRAWYEAHIVYGKAYGCAVVPTAADLAQMAADAADILKKLGAA